MAGVTTVTTVTFVTTVTDIKAVGAFGRRAATVVVESDGLAPQEREAVAAERIRRLLTTELVG